MTNNVDNVNQYPPRSGEDIADEIHAIRHLFKRQRYAGAKLQDHELTHMEARVIFFVGNQPGATQSDAVSHFGRDKAQLARLIGTLRNEGLIETRTDAADKRMQRMFLTARGASIAGDAKRERRRLSALAVQGFKAEEQKALMQLLSRIRKNLESD
jgi:DNA-binding MarR family transcriptional regulator